MNEKQPLILLMKIENEEQLFSFLKKRNDDYKDTSVIFDETFLQNKNYTVFIDLFLNTAYNNYAAD